MFSAFDTSHGVISMLSSTLNKVSPIPYRTVNHPFHSKAESKDAVNCSVPMRMVRFAVSSGLGVGAHADSANIIDIHNALIHRFISFPLLIVECLCKLID